MIYSYFKYSKNHDQFAKYLKNNCKDPKENLSIKRKINKFNEFQFLTLLVDVTLYRNDDPLTIDTLNYFFYLDFEVQPKNQFHDYTLRLIDDPYFEKIFMGEVKAYLNCTYELDLLINYIFETTEFSKQSKIRKLTVLSDRVLNDMWHDLLSAKYLFTNFCENKNNYNDKRLGVFVLIKKALEDFENHISMTIDGLEEKIEILSKPNFTNERSLLNIDNKILKKIYFGLEKHMFIDQEKTSEEDFIKVFTSDSESHNSIVYFNMDNIQFNFFINSIYKFLNIKINLTSIELLGKIENKNGKIKAKSIYVSVSKSGMQPKNYKLIESIFK
ncbi:hypothetical protein FVB9288_01128 [Flavobacterium sp. CECT 9288]|uniref:hypothetical protein n=2 Tax=unclassified Flavobacterium TaxID=196869 RepID=UPI001E3D057E|nr:hypothetical protein [Flavobacterium sp. CECT 9288]CAH0335483.1 hypothetical protein FVB9288_01128 [Flavobacterium sp. CECT 9288]